MWRESGGERATTFDTPDNGMAESREGVGRRQREAFARALAALVDKVYIALQHDRFHVAEARVADRSHGCGAAPRGGRVAECGRARGAGAHHGRASSRPSGAGGAWPCTLSPRSDEPVRQPDP